MPADADTLKKNTAASPQFLGFVMVDIESIAEVYTQYVERSELIRAVASGEPACFIYASQRRRRPTS